jgi:hypothetical protein
LISSINGYSFGSFVPSPEWNRQSFFNGLPSFQSGEYGVCGEPEDLGPFGETESSSLERKESVPSRVPLLFSICRPTAVVRFVISIVVNAVERVVGRWAKTHIGEECFEDSPSFADFNSSASVFREARMVSSEASFSHVYPRLEFRLVDAGDALFHGTPLFVRTGS